MKITRVVCTPDGICREPGCIIEPSFVPDACIVQETGSPIPFYSESGRPLFSQEGWELTKKDIMRYSIEGTAQVVTKRTVDGERTFVEHAKDVRIGSAYEGTLYFSIGEKERILGLGQHEDGIANYRDCTQHLYQNNMQIPMPVFLSDGGYAVLIDANCLMVYEEHGNRIAIHLDAADQIAYYVIADDSPVNLVKGIRRLTGKAAMLPLWAYGYVQSRERYKNQTQLLEVADEFGKRQIPVSCLVQDWMTWESGKWGDKHLDKTRYPNLKEATDRLHEKGIAFMCSVWPNINKGSQDNLEMLEAGKLYANLSTYDAFDEEARALYWKQCEREIFAGGTDAWWCDSTEPFTPDWNGSVKKTAEERYLLTKESSAKYMDARQANAFALYHAMGIHDNQRKADSSIRVVNLTRSGYPSIQRYGTILWSGDIMATWDVFKKQITEGLQMAASGIPYWTLDIGAFFAGNLNAWKRWSGSKEGTQPWFWNGDYEDGIADPGYCELYTRWMQYGTFLPVMRSHGTDTPREPWQFGEPGSIWYDTIVKYIRLRYHLVPYIYSLAWSVYREDDMMMRSLLFDYPADERAADAADEYLFGDFLVCPVTFPVAWEKNGTPLNREAKRKVYLPQGDIWYDYETGECISGGREILADAPVEKMPLYIRGGSILPVNREDRADLYAPCRPEQMTLEIYAGRDGSFTVYFDRGNGYEYQSGEYAAIRVSWDDKGRTATLWEAEGSYEYPGQWELCLLDEKGNRITAQTVYRGKKIRVVFPETKE